MKFSDWRKKHRFALQAAALILGVAAPFAVYYALAAGVIWLAVLCFGVLALAMLITTWAG